MTNPDYTYIKVIVDRSGSMDSIKSDAEGGLNAFMAEQKKLPGKATINIAQFDSEYETVIPTKDLAKNRKKFVLTPRGSTALLDAIGRGITEVGDELSSMSEEERPGNVLFVIITDGLENASREFTRDDIFEKINHQRDVYGWNFVFLAANQDAIQTGQYYGFNPSDSLTYAASAKGVAGMSEALNTYSSTLRSAGHAAFTDEDRSAAVDSNQSV